VRLQARDGSVQQKDKTGDYRDDHKTCQQGQERIGGSAINPGIVDAAAHAPDRR
jgi:hypothetical protein